MGQRTKRYDELMTGFEKRMPELVSEFRDDPEKAMETMMGELYESAQSVLGSSKDGASAKSDHEL